VDVQEKPPGKLRTGFTTGTSATAASVAAILSIIDQKKIKSVDVILPKKDKIKISINSCEFEKNKACCSVIKDGGDDPDVTHDAEIVVDLELTSKPNSVEIDGGEGVGRVTKPGIGLEIGQAAINPTPRKMITENLTQVGKKILEKNGIKVVISVPKGKELGPKTDNPRIGIIGGISILGTSGIVIPYSTASFAAAIRQQIDVVVSMGDDTTSICCRIAAANEAVEYGITIPLVPRIDIPSTIPILGLSVFGPSSSNTRTDITTLIPFFSRIFLPVRVKFSVIIFLGMGFIAA
jgi:cobalt-precorrin-5B (C1)-methyltransferase